MNSIGLLIQRTNAGFKDVFISANLEKIRKTTEIEKTAKDEGEISTRLANQSDVYTVQVTTNYRVYSFVNTGITDSFGRAAFYAIRLYAPKKYPLAAFEAILEQINKKYLEYERSGTPQNNQSYDELLQPGIPLEVTQQDFIFVKSNDDAFCLFNPTDTQLSHLFNDKSIALYNKVYAFNQERAVNSEIMKTLGLKSYAETKNNGKEVFIDNNARVLKELKVNTIPIEFNTNESNYTLICKASDVLVYNTTDNANFRPIDGAFIKIESKIVHKPILKHQNKGKEKTFWQENGIYLVIGFLAILFAGGTWWQFEGKNWWQNYNRNSKKVQTEETPPTDTIKKITFLADGSPKDSSVYKTNYPKLEKYRFKINDKKWTYKNTEEKNKYADFYKKNLDEIIKKDSVKMDDKTKTEFLKSLGKIGGENILEKVVNEKTSDEIINPEKVIKKEAPKPIKNKVIPAAKKANPKDDMKVDANLKV